ncbi:hypothetical protein QVD17_37632 [Tagetes erecta]|uniref:Uncharacterized protein n=1 Tax=Tagetes erecta TaxID=13708 RepID=A0AAD8JWD5_TARER|nr:hypothetical protein QVD17_37632 [Tagetes erecta]
MCEMLRCHCIYIQTQVRWQTDQRTLDSPEDQKSRQPTAAVQRESGESSIGGIADMFVLLNPCLSPLNKRSAASFIMFFGLIEETQTTRSPQTSRSILSYSREDPPTPGQYFRIAEELST